MAWISWCSAHLGRVSLFTVVIGHLARPSPFHCIPHCPIRTNLSCSEEESNSDNSCAASWRHFTSFCTLAESNVLKCDNSSRWSEQQLARRIHYVRSHWHVTSAKCYAEPFLSFPISISPWHTTTMLCKSCYHSRNEHNSLARQGTCCSKLQNSKGRKGCSNRCCCRCHGPLAQMQWPRQEVDPIVPVLQGALSSLCYPWMTKYIKTPPGTDMRQIACNSMYVAKSGLRMWRLHIHVMSWMDGKRVGVGIVWCCSPSSARAQTLAAVSPSLGSMSQQLRLLFSQETTNDSAGGRWVYEGQCMDLQ